MAISRRSLHRVRDHMVQNSIDLLFPAERIIFTLTLFTATGATLKPAANRFTCKFFTRLILAFWLLAMAGCSSTTFLYNRLHIILPWYMGGYVDLDREQKDYLDELLVPFLDWHRSEELPRYLQIIEDMEAVLDDGISAEDVSGFALRFEAAWFRLEERGVAWLLDLGAQLSDEQLEEFIDELWDKQEDFEKKYLQRTDEEFHRETYENLRDSLQDYLGRLDAAQRELLQEAGAGLIRSDSTWLSERAAWIERLEVFLQREPGWQDAIRVALDNRNDHVSDAYRETYEHNTQVIAAAIAATINSRTDKQDRRLRRKLADLREDMQSLINQA